MVSDDAAGEAIPTPGSAEAKVRGCSCPVTEDSTGSGYVVRGAGVTYWWQDDKCPLHGFGTGYKWNGKGGGVAGSEGGAGVGEGGRGG